MRGHEALIAMRRRGQVPAAVWLTLDPDVTWRDWTENGSHAQVLIEPTDSIALLDLRFLVGMQTWVEGSDEQRVERLHAACIEAGASRVLTAVLQPNHRGEPTTARMMDSAGLLEAEFA